MLLCIALRSGLFAGPVDQNLYVCVCRCVYAAAVWYYNHLAGMMNLVMITEDSDAVSRFSSLNSGVYVISVQVGMFGRHSNHPGATLIFTFLIFRSTCRASGRRCRPPRICTDPSARRCRRRRPTARRGSFQNIYLLRFWRPGSSPDASSRSGPAGILVQDVLMELLIGPFLLQGTLNVSKHRAQNEAFVTSDGLSSKSPGEGRCCQVRSSR